MSEVVLISMVKSYLTHTKIAINIIKYDTYHIRIIEVRITDTVLHVSCKVIYTEYKETIDIHACIQY